MKLIFLQLRSVEQAMARVQLRVRQGGHSIPPEVVVRRFKAGLRNVADLYRPLVDERRTINNGGHVLLLINEEGRA